MSNEIELSEGTLGHITGSVDNGVTVKPGNLVTYNADGDLVQAGTGDKGKILMVVLPRFGAGETADTSIASPATGAKQTVQCLVLRSGQMAQIRVAAGTYRTNAALTAGASGNAAAASGTDRVIGWVTPDGDSATARTAGDLVSVLCA